MASLNLSANGPSISKSYQSVVNAPSPSGPASTSPTYGQWAVFSVVTPLVNAFQPDAGAKESVLRVQSTGDGELVDLVDEFSDGKAQFAFVKVKDPNTGLPKHVLIGWCGEGVPERTKGYFANYQAATAKLLHGYHVQITARSDRDLSPESIVQKVADASGSKYSVASSAVSPTSPPALASKPAYLPTRSVGAAGFSPLAGSTRAPPPRSTDVNDDGWGADAPPVTRTQLEKVEAAYRPTKVNMGLQGNIEDSAVSSGPTGSQQSDRPDVVKGTYQPIGKVDIAAIRREAQASASFSDDRPTTVKGAYEPVGKVDIAAIRARAQQPPSVENVTPNTMTSDSTDAEAANETPKSLAERSAAFSQSERLTSLPKPKVSNRFGGAPGNFAGTKAPLPGEFGRESNAAPRVTSAGASRTFADEGGKTPAQLWAEKKAKQSGLAGPVSPGEDLKFPDTAQATTSGEWKSGYGGKKWAPVQISKTGQPNSTPNQGTAEEDDKEPYEETQRADGGISSVRNRFNEAPSMGAGAAVSNADLSAPPRLDTSTKPGPNRGVPIPGFGEQPSREQTPQIPVPPPQQPRSPTPPTPASRDASPIRIAVPIGRDLPKVENARGEQGSPPPSVPVDSLSNEALRHEETREFDEPAANDAARAAAAQVAASSFDDEVSAAPSAAAAPAGRGGMRALAQYDYEKAEDNELELREGEYVLNIEMVDEDWWMGENSRGETGLFPSNYVELVDSDAAAGVSEAQQEQPIPDEAISNPVPSAAAASEKGLPTATALYDYEAGEDNELNFPEGAKITNVEFPDDDWWSGEYGGHAGLFPANYVQLDQ